MDALEEHRAVRKVTFDIEHLRFTVELEARASVARAELEALAMEHAKARGMDYTLFWEAPKPSAKASARPPLVGQRALGFELPTLAGPRKDVGALIGTQPLVLVFWASWCAPCIEEAPKLVELYERYADRGVAFVGVSIDEAAARQELAAKVKALGIPYPVLLDVEGHALGLFTDAGSIPLTLFIDRHGVIRTARQNYVAGDEDELEKAVASIVSE